MQNSSFSINSSEKTSEQVIEEKRPVKKGYRHTSLIYGTEFYSNKALFKRHLSFKSQILENTDKGIIFEKVKKFMEKIIDEKEYMEEILNKLSYKSNRKNISIQLINKTVNSIQDGESAEIRRSIRDSLKFSFQNYKQNKNLKRKNVSILLENTSFSDISSGFFCSEQINADFKSLKLNISLTKQAIEEIFEQPQPFLINLSLCIMLKFISYSEISFQPNNWSWISSIATIVAYKIYYDEPVGGLVDSFSEILKISKEQVSNLEKYFLQQIGYEAVITNEQYQKVLGTIMTL